MKTFFSSLSTMWKLMLGFLMVSAIMGLVGYIGATGMRTINDSVENINNVQLKPLMTLTRIRGLVYQMRAQAITALLTQNAADRQEALARITELNRQVDQNQEAFAKTIKAEAVQKAYDDFRTLYDDYRSYRDTIVFKHLLAGDHASAQAAMNGDGAAKFKASIGSIDNLVDIKMQIAQGKYEAAQTTYQDARTLMMVAITLGISLGLSLGWMIARILSRGLAEVGTVLHLAAQGDLTKRVAIDSKDELGTMAGAFNTMLDSLARIVTSVREATESITAASGQISTGVQDLSQRTSEQASSLEETTASMEEMTSTVKQNADNAKQANQLAAAARDIADRGGTVTQKAVDAMGEINKSSKKIADIITVIDEIAFQTNLLALNAAVEAARAGEHGRGFAVVAAEVRNLAQRSATAAKEIKGLINESIQRVGDGSELVNRSGKTLEEIVSSVKRVTDIIAEITAASQEQAQGIDQVNKAIMQMDETTQQNAALVEQSAAASEGMQQQASHLQKLVTVFKVSAPSASAVDRPAPERTPTAAKKHMTQLVDSPAAHSTARTYPSTGTSRRVSEPVGIAAGNGHDRRRRDDDFEEF